MTKKLLTVVSVQASKVRFSLICKDYATNSWDIDLVGLIWFYGISTIVGYLMPNPLYTYILNIYDLVWFGGISTIVGYLMPNPVYSFTSDIYDL